MGGIGSRLSKLEQVARTARAIIRSKAARDGILHDLRSVAAGCSTWGELADYLKVGAPDRGRGASADEQLRDDAARSAAARTIFEESRLGGAAIGGEHGGN